MTDESFDWLNVGSTFKSEPHVQPTQPLVQQVTVKKKKQEKASTKTNQIVIHLSQDKIDAYYEEKIEQQYKIDESKGFIYKHELGPGLLSIQLLPFGDEKIALYGIQPCDVPDYIALRLQDPQSYFQQQTNQIPRYFQAPQTFDRTIKIKKLGPIATNDEYIPFIDALLENEATETLNQEVVRVNQQLQSLLQTDVHNLQAWQQLLQLQEKLAIVQQYNEPTLVANRRLAIIAKLEKDSEVLADHPWVLAYKISLMQNLNLDDLNREINIAFQELIEKYHYLRPIWGLYLDNKLKTEMFSATLLRDEAQKQFKEVQKLIQSSTRSRSIQLYKKIYIELLQQIAFYEGEMGFKERAVGILQAMVELNIFSPKHLQRTPDFEAKFEAFKNYWDGGLKTGETSLLGWGSEARLEVSELTDSFIGKYDQKLSIVESEDLISQFLQFQQLDRWRPANQLFDQEWIQQNADSYVIYEDIEPYLYIFNDSETKIRLLSILLEQIGFPGINDTMLPQINSMQGTFMETYDIYRNDFLIPFKLEITNLAKNVYATRLVEQAYQILQKEALLLYSFIMNCILYLNGSENSMKAMLKEHQSKLVLWIVYAAIEEAKTKKRQQKLYAQILQFAKSRKQKMMVHYFRFVNQSCDFDERTSIVKDVVALYGEAGTTGAGLILRLRSLYMQTKFSTHLYLAEQRSKQFPLFQLSKRSMLLLFLMYFEQYSIEPQLKQLSQEYATIVQTRVTEQMQNVIQKYQNEISLLLLGLLRFAVDQEMTSRYALRLQPDQLLFFVHHVKLISKKHLYFVKLDQFSTIPQKCWITHCLQEDPNKRWFLYEFLKKQSGKQLSTIYCESSDQENFDTLINLKYNYIMEKMILDLSWQISPSVKQIYLTSRKYPYSIDIYKALVQELKEYKESINMINEMQEKELKFL